MCACAHERNVCWRALVEHAFELVRECRCSQLVERVRVPESSCVPVCVYLQSLARLPAIWPLFALGASALAGCFAIRLHVARSIAEVRSCARVEA